MKLRLIAEQDYLDELIEVYHNIADRYELPCPFEVSFEASDKVSINGVAETLYTEQEIKEDNVKTLYSRHYFKLNSGEKSYTFLHEFIHACHLTNELERWNKRRLAIVREFKELLQEQIEKHGHFHGDTINMQDNITLIDFMFTYIMEIWSELRFKDQYSDFFEERMRYVYEMLREQWENNKFRDYGSREKYVVFLFMLRPSYLGSLSKGYNVSERFRSLYYNVKRRLEDITSTEELRELQSLERMLTDYNEYPHSGRLEDAYVECAQYLWLHCRIDAKESQEFGGEEEFDVV